MQKLDAKLTEKIILAENVEIVVEKYLKLIFKIFSSKIV